MWYKLNQAIGIVLLVALLGGGAIYGLVLFLNAPPLIRQESQGEGQFQRQAKQDLQKHLRKLQDEQAQSFQKAMETGRSGTGS